MEKKKLITNYSEYETIDELTHSDRVLVEKALEASYSAYAPYSGFCVGAAIRLDDGTIITGTNQENAAFPSGLCAERVALFYANSQFSDKKVVAMAIAASRNGIATESPVYPCGACRQVLLETENRFLQPIRIIFAGTHKIQILEDARDLLPMSFDFNMP